MQSQFYQAAQDWQQWGGQMAQAGMSLMNAGLLGGAGGASVAAPDADALAEGLATRTMWEESGLANPIKGLNPVQQIKIKNASNGGLITPPNAGGLVGVNR